MSIRGRMTLWYSALLAALLALFSVSVYLTLSRSLRVTVDQTIAYRAQEVGNAISEVLTARADPLAYLLRERVVLPAIDVFASPGLYVQVLTTDGRLIAKSGNLGDQSLPITRDELAQVVGDAEPVLVTSEARRISLREISVPITWQGDIIGVVQVARSLEEVEEALAQLAKLLLVWSAAGLLVSVAVGSWMSGRALRPIDDVTRTARSIVEAQDLSRRLDDTGPQDEVGRLATTINRMLERIDGLFRSQQRFIADVSHELRTPLTTVRGYLGLLRRSEARHDLDAQAEILDTVESEVARMSRLAADLLLLAQAEAGIELAKVPVELDTLILDVYRQAKALSGAAGLGLGNEDQIVVRGDPDRLRQLLLNLIDNALKYTPADGQVTVSLTREKQDGREWALVEVADSGIGIPPEDLPHVFERFYRVDKARSRDQGGTGLGLAIARWIVVSHGGRIAVESAPGQGSVFRFWLPLASDTI